MQRNMDLVRTILMRIEENVSGFAPRSFGIEGFGPDQVGYHVHIMIQEGLIEGVDITNMMSKGPEAVPTRLTWAGHEFLDLARDHERWIRAKAIISKVGSAPLTVWKQVLTDLIMSGVKTAVGKG